MPSNSPVAAAINPEAVPPSNAANSGFVAARSPPAVPANAVVNIIMVDTPYSVEMETNVSRYSIIDHPEGSRNRSWADFFVTALL
jgi:hypothetical protein